MNPLDKQHGGNHYKDSKIQPIEFIQANNYSFAQGCIVKYNHRFLEKGGFEDLQKIIHYAQFLMAHHYPDESKEAEAKHIDVVTNNI